MEKSKTYRPVLLVVLDGWGISLTEKGNAIQHARTPIMDALEQVYPMASLRAAGIAVGLPWGEPGNSEVGHTNLGAGFVRYQSLPRITMEIQNGEFFVNEALLKSTTHCRENKSALHLMGLLSDGGVHSSIEHLGGLLDLAKREGVKDVFVHCFTDGRDVAPQSAKDYFAELKKLFKKYRLGKVASVSGRFYALDRNNNWDRVEKAYKAICGTSDEQVSDPMKQVKKAYAADKSDEYVEPAFVTKKSRPVNDNDAVIFFDFRPDRAHELTKAFTVPGFSKFPIKEFKNLQFTTMTKYDESLPVDVAYPDVAVSEPLSGLISAAKLRQLHIAETEKYAHVTYFFNGGQEKPFIGEEQVLIPSPAVANYAERPDMSARLITDRVNRELLTGKWNFIMINYANPDMVGHTGDMKAAVKAVETVDEELGKLIKTVVDVGGSVVITADHGNAEQMLNPKTGEVETSHSTNAVPFILVDNRFKRKNSAADILQAKSNPVGMIADISPTVLDLLAIKKPDDMTGVSLVQHLV